MADVPLMPERHVLERHEGIRAQQAGHAGDPLGEHRVALVRHRRGSLLARRERFEGLAHLAALQVPDLGRHALQGPAQDRQDADQLGMAIAADDLRRGRIGAEPQPLHDRGLDLRGDVGMGAHRP